MAVRKSLENDGLNLTVRKVFIMGNMPNTETKSGPGSPVDLSDGSIRSGQVEVSEKSASGNSLPTTNAGTPSGSKKTWTNAELDELRRKAGLVAGALADFQAAGGLVAVKNIEYTSPSGSKLTATRLILVAEGASLKVSMTADGLDFDLVAEPSGSEK